MAITVGQFPGGFTNVVSGNHYDAFRIPPMPDDGWVIGIAVAYDSWDSGSQQANWGIHGDQGQGLYGSSTTTWATSGSQVGGPFRRALVKHHDLPTPLRVNAGQQIYPGVGHAEQMGFVCDINNMTPGGGQNWYELDWNTSSGVPSDVIPGHRSFAPQVQVWVDFEAQVIPQKPVWLSPTAAQNSTTTDTSPELRFSLPHAEQSDSSKTVEIELTILNTGAFQRWTMPVSAAQNNLGYYSWSPLTFQPGDQIQVRARHSDTWDDFSEWSDYRVFSVFDAPPGKGSWTSPTPAEGALVSDSTPTVAGTTPHPGADGAYDATNGVQIQLIDNDTDAVLQDVIFGPTPQERAAKNFSYTLLAIPQNTNARIRFRHHDIKGSWSVWSDDRNFSISAGPDLPIISRPKGKINFRNQAEYQAQPATGNMYAGTYNNISGTAMHSVRVQIWNADASARLIDSGWVAATATAGVWTLAQAAFPASGTDVLPHPSALGWGTSYQIRANVSETSGGVRGIESGWGDFQTFTTNSFPNRPTSLSPADGIPSATLQFAANASDPDGDTITQARMTIKRVSDNATVLNQGPMDVVGNSLSKTLAAGILTLGQEYQWFCEARDAVGWGQPSFPEPFVYAAVPSPTILAPMLAERTNLVRDPSAEYESAALETSPYWSTLNPASGNSITRSNEMALYGNYSFKAVTTASNTITFQSEATQVVNSEPYLLQMEAKKASGTTAMSFRLRCLNASGGFISNVTPTSIAAASVTNVPTTWTRYGGVVWPVGNPGGKTPTWPPGTDKVQIEIIPSTNSIAQVYFDGVSLERLPNTAYSAVQWLEAQKWFGYFDGDNPSHSALVDDYYWVGGQGVSRSRGEPRLSGADGQVFFTFTHNQGMTGRRVLIDRYSSAKNTWVQIYDSGHISLSAASGTINSIDLPAGVIRNDDRYRFRIQVRDALGISGESIGTVSDIEYIGQPEPAITSISSDPGSATVTFTWDPTSVADANFGGYEIARQLPDYSFVVLHREMNKNHCVFTDHYPLSDVTYTYKVRVVDLVGIDEQQGRWGTAAMNVNYWPNNFVKDTQFPETLYAAFETPLEAMPTPEEDAISEILIPWGQSRPLVLTRADMRLRSGTVVAHFYKDNFQVEDYRERYEKMRKIAQRRGTICVLMQEPDKERIFASVMGPMSKRFTGPEQRAIEFAYQENSFQEDLRDREDES